MIRLTITEIDKKRRIGLSREKKNFKTLNEALEFFRELSKGRKISKVYVDQKDGSAMHCGFLFSQWSTYEDTKERFPLETWVSFDMVNVRLLNLSP